MVGVAIALMVVWGSQAQPAWLIQSVAQGPDAAKQRVIEPDVAVQSYETHDIVYISYIDQKENAIMLLAFKVWQENDQIKKEQVAKTGLKRDTGRVIGTTVAVDDILVCVDWEELSDESGVHEVWQACWEQPLANDAAPKVEPWRWSTEGVIAGQASGAGWQEFGFNFDNTFAPDGTLYAIWTEDYSALKAAKYKDGALSACGDFPKLPIPEAPNRYPTIYVDSEGGVWVAVGDVSYPPGPNVWVYYSGDQCATWQGPWDMTPTGLFSDMGGIVRLGDKIYVVYDEDQGAAPGTADINVTTCTVARNAEGKVTGIDPATCVRGIVHREGGFPHIATDGKGLYVASDDSNANVVRFSYSCDAGATWNPVDIPNKWNSGYRDPDFGAVLSRKKVAVDHFVYVVWFWRSEGKSNIMLGILPKPCQ